MLIDNLLLKEALEIQLGESINCKALAMVNSEKEDSLTFLDNEKFAGELNKNANITAAFVTESLFEKVSPRIKRIIVDDPRFYFYTLLNYVGRKNYRKNPSVIHSTASIHPRAYVCEYNVEIGENTIIEPNVTVLSDVTIGRNCIIRAGAVVGSEGYEHKRTSRGVLSVFHDGVVIIGDAVEIGANSCVDKGFSFRQTIIRDDTKIDNLVHVGHGVQTGKRCFFAACSMVGGSVTYGDDVWVGPNATVTSGLRIADEAFVTIGSVVTKNVNEGEKVTGNFAIAHQKFLENLKKSVL